MIVCKVCGNQNKDAEAFCTSCGRSLDLFGEKVADAPPPPPPPVVTPPTPEPEPDLIGRVKQAVGIEQRPRVEPPPPPPAEFSVPPTPVAEPPVQTPVAAAPTGIGESVAPQQEQERPAPRTDMVAPQRMQPGDVVCPRCGAYNGADRHFCQRCGANLKAVAATPVKVPWWRKLFPARTAPDAGARRGTAPFERKWGTAAFRVIGLGVIAVVVLGYLAVPPVRARVNDSVGSAYGAVHKRFFATKTPVRPSDATASSSVATHPARLTIDLVTETYWAANTTTDKQPWVRLVFASPVDINTILVTSGAGADFATIGRPKDVKILFSDKSSVTLTLNDDPNPQSYDLGSMRHTTFAEIHILSVYPSAQSPDVAINEIEFWRIQ